MDRADGMKVEDIITSGVIHNLVSNIVAASNSLSDTVLIKATQRSHREQHLDLRKLEES